MGLITCSCSALGALGKLITEETGTAPRTFDDNSIRHELIYETLGTKRLLQYTGAITGSLSRFSGGVREKSYLSQGTIAVQPSPAQLTTWLPRIFGGPLVGTNVALSDNPPEFDVLVYRENGIFQYTDAVVAQAVLRGRTANGGKSLEFMELLINVVGKAEQINQVAWPVPEPALGTTEDYLPYMFFESELTLNGIEVEYEAFSMVVNNNVDVRFYNKNVAQCIRSTGRDIEMMVQAPFTCDNLTEALSLNTTSGTGQFKLETATANMSTIIAFPALRNTFETPTIPGKQTVPLKFGLEAYSLLGNDEATITHDATP